uniref:Uncharacterized protein n=1 Tax=Romanomermis culicivorax TaxID=13658 RepID=A0A915J4H0_ROMCU
YAVWQTSSHRCLTSDKTFRGCPNFPPENGNWKISASLTTTTEKRKVK